MHIFEFEGKLAISISKHNVWLTFTPFLFLRNSIISALLIFCSLLHHHHHHHHHIWPYWDLKGENRNRLQLITIWKCFLMCWVRLCSYHTVWLLLRHEKSYRIGILFTHKDVDFGAISVTKRSQAAPTLNWRILYRIGVHTIRINSEGFFLGNLSSELSPGSAGKEDTESTEDCEFDKKLDQYKVGEDVNCFVKMVSFIKTL